MCLYPTYDIKYMRNEPCSHITRSNYSVNKMTSAFTTLDGEKTSQKWGIRGLHLLHLMQSDPGFVKVWSNMTHTPTVEWHFPHWSFPQDEKITRGEGRRAPTKGWNCLDLWHRPTEGETRGRAMGSEEARRRGRGGRTKKNWVTGHSLCESSLPKACHISIVLKMQTRGKGGKRQQCLFHKI